MSKVSRIFSRCAVRTLVLVFGVALLSACASSWSAKVTTFQNWPSDAFSSPYYIEAAPAGLSPLEHQAVADSLRVAMGAVGLLEGDATSRLQVSVQYENPLSRQWVERYSDYYDGFSPHAFVWGGFGHRSTLGGVFYSPRVITVPMDVYQNTLRVVIKDKAMNGAEIYNVRVINESDTDNLIEVMPYLAQAAFSDFPGLNGKTQYINIKRNP